MKFISSRLCYRISALCISLALLLTSFIPVQADNEIKDLEETTSGLESELSGLNNELETLSAELDDITSKIRKTASNLKETREELAIAKGKEAAQYEAMTLRIQYMYENGNTSILEILFSSKSMAEFLNNAEYYSSIMEYDRAVLEELSKTREQIAANENQLEKDQKYLQTLQEELDKKEQELQNKISETSADLSEYTTKLEAAREEAKKTEEEATEEITPIIPAKPAPDEPDTPDIETTTRPGVEFTAEDVELLAALIECEAGSRNYEGMLAVGSVVVNRMKHRDYPDTLYGVIYQSGQFSPAGNGKVEKVLARGVKDSCVKAAQDALNGKNNVGDCLSFRASSSGHSGTIIGDNVFF